MSWKPGCGFVRYIVACEVNSYLAPNYQDVLRTSLTTIGSLVLCGMHVSTHAIHVLVTVCMMAFCGAVAKASQRSDLRQANCRSTTVQSFLSSHTWRVRRYFKLEGSAYYHLNTNTIPQAPRKGIWRPHDWGANRYCIDAHSSHLQTTRLSNSRKRHPVLDSRASYILPLW